VYRVKEFASTDIPVRDLLDESGELRLNSDIEKNDYFTIQLSKGRLCVRARGYVGLISLNDRVAIDVVPRTPFTNLSRVLMVSRHVPESLARSRPYPRDSLWIDSLLDAYTEALLSQVEEIASQGLLREYRRHDVVTASPRGRILATATARLQARGKSHEVATSRFERTADNAANRCLKYALWFLAGRLANQAPRERKHRNLLDRLAPLYAMFEEAPLDHSLGFLRDRLVDGRQRLPSLRSYYRPALDIAAAIVFEHGVKLDAAGGTVQLPSLALDMGRLFEQYLRNVLRAEARERGWTEAVLDGNMEGRSLLFDEQPSADATPDIVLHEPATDRYPLIVEVKDVPVKDFHSDRSALEQAITYGVSYRCNTVVLAHPRAESNSFTGLRRQGRMGELTIYQYVFDLAADPLQDEETRFTSAMEQLLAPI
jgi:5-methylcytosine-specific restriction enzyme subunit McrC